MFEAGEHDIEELTLDGGPDDTRVDGLPPGYSLRTDGVYRAIEADDGPRWVWLCSPLRVLALPRDANGRGWGRLLEVADPDGRTHRWAMPAELLAGDGLDMRRELLRLGLRLSTDKGARNALSALMTTWIPAARARTTDRLGWTGEACSAFALGDGRVIGDDDVVYQSEQTPAAAVAMTKAGTLDDWRKNVAALCVGNPLLMLGVSCGFAGALLEPLALDGGGFHLRGASSRGKSTIQRAAVSVWGGPAFKHTWRATANGLEAIAAACNGSLLALDELAEINGREAGAAAYMLANGAGKSRANRSGGARVSARWRVMILSSGEISLADKLVEAGERAKAGQAVRLLDIPADTRVHGAFDDLHGTASGATFADRLTTATTTAYGSAGPAFVDVLLADLDGARGAIREAIAVFEADAATRFSLDGEGQIARALKRFALVAAAGETATAYDLTGWPSGAAREAALELFGAWLDGRGGTGAHEAADAITRTRAFLAAHGASRFEALDTDDDAPTRATINRAGWKRGGMFFIASDTWASEVHKGADPKRAARALADAGLLERGEGRNLMRKVDGAEGRPRAYAVPVKILGADDCGGGNG